MSSGHEISPFRVCHEMENDLCPHPLLVFLGAPLIWFANICGWPFCVFTHPCQLCDDKDNYPFSTSMRKKCPTVVIFCCIFPVLFLFGIFCVVLPLTIALIIMFPCICVYKYLTICKRQCDPEMRKKYSQMRSVSSNEMELHKKIPTSLRFRKDREYYEQYL